MVGTESSPMVTTVAPTIPVVAPSSAPTMTTDTATPPRSRPNTRAMVSSRSSARPDRSSTTPMKTNKGTAIRVTLPITPQMRRGSRLKKLKPKPVRPNRRAVPIRVKVTGKPAMSATVRNKNIHNAR
jgi:hypothetical protein